MKVKPLLLVPLAIFAALAGLFLGGLTRGGDDSLVSPFIDQPAPELAAVQLADLPSFDSSIMADGEVKMVNFWASWCPPCRAEHPALVQLASEGIPVYGVNKSDEADNALSFLNDLGNPYRAVTVDADGRQSLNWGIVALPETFIIDGDGVVVLKFAGPIHGVMDSVIRPALAKAAE